MTGFAQVRSHADGAGSGQPAFTLSLKSVNHRYLDLQMRMPSETDGLEMKLRRLLKEKMARGHVEVTLSLEYAGNNGVGKVTVGSSTNGGKCTITFANSFAFGNAPVCMVADVTTPANVVKAVTTTTTLAITAASSITAGDVLTYRCEGYY